jgi:regulator of replication initiation timing
MKKLTLVVDERELSTIRAALFLLQEQVDALPEDLAEMLAEHGPPMTEIEIERLSLRLDEQASPRTDSADQEFPRTKMVVEVERFTVASIAQGPA